MTCILQKENFDCENEKLDKNAYNLMKRTLLGNTWLQIKTSTNQNFLLFHEFNFLKENIHTNKETSLIFDSFIQFSCLNERNILQIVFDFIT